MLSNGLSPEKTLVILLGASKFPDYKELDSLAFEQSCTAVRQYFENLAIPDKSIKNLFDDTSSPKDILITIGLFLEEKINEDKNLSHLIIYYVGHGGFEEKNDMYYLACGCTNKEYLGDTSIRVNALARELQKKAPFLYHIIIFDACFAGTSQKYFQDFSAEKGAAILCSSAANATSKVGAQYTKFTEALLYALNRGDKWRHEYLSLSDLNEIIKKYLVDTYNKDNLPVKGYAPNSEIYTSTQKFETLLQDNKLFPNYALSIKNNIPKGEFVPQEDTIQCCVIISETEENAGETLSTTVTTSLSDYGEYILAVSDKKNLDGSPYVIYVTQALSSVEAYRNAIAALCCCQIVIVDLTNYEPGTMLFLGIRSVVRRGVTLTTAGGNYKVGDTLDFPFNIKDVNIIPHSLKVLESNIEPSKLIGERIQAGFKQLGQLPNYLDLPAFDAVRNLPPDIVNQQPKSYSEQVLLLCSFSKTYRLNNWTLHLKRHIPSMIRKRLKEQNKPTDLEKPEIYRTLDLKTPRLVSQALYEGIRLTDMCIIDWTEWRPNVFFELGIRLATNDLGAVSIIERSHRKIIDDILTNTMTEQEVKKQLPTINTKLIYCKFQCKRVLDFFNPVEYLAASNGNKDEQGMTDIVHAYEKLMNADFDQIPGISPKETFLFITNKIDIKVEAAATPVHVELVNAANVMSNPNSDSTGILPGLYPSNALLVKEARKGGFERRVAAWLYLYYRHGTNEILKSQELTKEFYDISHVILPVLLDSLEEADLTLATLVSEQLDLLEK